MKLEYVNPFVQSIYELFETMLDCKVERGSIGVSDTMTRECEVIALIGLSGSARGTVALSLPHATALALVSRFIGTEITEVDATVSDAAAELVNIIAGGAKAKLSGGGSPIDLGLPSVIHGKEYTVDYPKGVTWLDVPFNSEVGSFSLRLTIMSNGCK